MKEIWTAYVDDKEINRLIKKLDYKGCKNCVNKIEPLRMCEWAEQGGDERLHIICPRWEKKNEKM